MSTHTTDAFEATLRDAYVFTLSERGDWVNTCPNCGASMLPRKCKLLCSRTCGYQVTCSE